MFDFKKLLNIQQKLKVPKTKKTTHYNFRNLDDILETVKPLLKEENLILVIPDKIVQVGDRNYVESTATLIDVQTGESYSATASAREALTSRNGMDDSQLTGSTSSYARKYACNALFALDDTKDADDLKADSEKADTNTQAPPKTSSKSKYVLIEGTSCKVLTKEGMTDINSLTIEQLGKLYDNKNYAEAKSFINTILDKGSN